MDCDNRGAGDGGPSIFFFCHSTLLWQPYCANSIASLKSKSVFFTQCSCMSEDTLNEKVRVFGWTKNICDIYCKSKL